MTYDNNLFSSLTVFQGKNSAIRHCLYGQDMHNIQFEYINKFWEAYPNNRKFFRTDFTDAHEVTGELIQYMDEDLRDFLQDFYDKGYFEDTFVTILSDHGAHALVLRFPAIPDNSRYIENYYPILFHITKKDIPDVTLHFLESNEQSFIGSHDIYATIKSIAVNEIARSPKAESYAYIYEQIPDSHDCSNSTVFISACWCSHDYKAIEKRMHSINIFHPEV